MSDRQIFVVPVGGLRVPVFGGDRMEKLPKEGAYVTDCVYWRNMIRRGEVVRGQPCPAHTAASRKKTAQVKEAENAD